MPPTRRTHDNDRGQDRRYQPLLGRPGLRPGRYGVAQQISMVSPDYPDYMSRCTLGHEVDMKQSSNDPDRVSYVEPDLVRVVCSCRETCEQLVKAGFKRRLAALLRWEKRVTTECELGEVLCMLRDVGLPFEDYPQGWSPAAVFARLRELKLVAGSVSSITNVGGQRGSPLWKLRPGQ